MRQILPGLMLDKGQTKGSEICREGTWMLGDGSVFELPEAGIDSMCGSFAGAGRLQCNYGHQHHGRPEETIAAGWIQRIWKSARADGAHSLMGKIEWTKRAADMIRNNEMRYLSAEISFNSPSVTSGERVPYRLEGAALCNRPALPLDAVILHQKQENNTMSRKSVFEYYRDNPYCELYLQKAQEMLAQNPGLQPWEARQRVSLANPGLAQCAWSPDEESALSFALEYEMSQGLTLDKAYAKVAKHYASGARNVPLKTFQR